MMPRSDARPHVQMPSILEPAHIRTDFDNEHVSGQDADARDRSQEVPGS